MSLAFTLSINKANIGIVSDVTHYTLALRRATTFDSFVIVPEFKVKNLLTAGVGTVQILPNSDGSIYDITFYNSGTKLLQAFFIMPSHDVNIWDLELLTAYNGDEGSVAGVEKLVELQDVDSNTATADRYMVVYLGGDGHPRFKFQTIPWGALTGNILAQTDLITYLGARGRTSVKDFGALGDGSYALLSSRYSTLAEAQAVYPHVQSLTQSIDWAALQAAANSLKAIYVPTGIYCINERLDFFTPFVGDGCADWDQKATWRPRKIDRGTIILAFGTPLAGNHVTVDCVSNVDVGGGVLLNDNYMIPAPNDIPSEDFSGNQYYSLLDFTNADAAGAKRATPKKIKAAIRLHQYASVNNLRVMLNYSATDGANGVNCVGGYNSSELLVDFPEYNGDYYASHKGLGDNWDIGVLTYNGIETQVSNCQIVGYWRMAARAIVSANYGDGKSSAGAWFYDSNVYYQGYVGLSIRGNDTIRVMSSTTSTVTVLWSASHCIPSTPIAPATTLSVYISGTLYTYTGLIYTAGSPATLTLTGFAADMSVLPSNPRMTLGVNPAFAGSSVSNGFITDMGHFSGYRPYDPIMDTPTANPGHAHEISGNPLRNIDFDNVHFFASDVVGWSHSASQCSYLKCYGEASGYASSVSIGSLTKGARWIAAPRPDSTDIRVPGSSGWTTTFNFDKSCQFGDGSIDFYPMYRSTNVNYRFQGTAKWFMPDVICMDATGYWTERNMQWRAYNGGTRQFATGPNLSWEIARPDFSRILYVDGSVTGAEKFGVGTNNPAVTFDIQCLLNTGFSLYQSTSQTLGDSTAQDPFFRLSSNISGVVNSWTIRTQLGSINQLQARYNNVTRFQISPTTGTIFSGGDLMADLGQLANRYNFGHIATVRSTTVTVLGSLGYITGAGTGGTVTQATSKSTGVTLNKITGSITMNNAALAGGAAVAFTLTNSTITSPDLLLLNITSGATTLTYSAHVENLAAGSARIVLRNYSATSQSEAVVLSYAVIKGAVT